MKTQDQAELLKEMAGCTEEILKAVDAEDIDRLGELISQRQIVLDKLQKQCGVKLSGNETEMEQLLTLDKKASEAISKLYERYKEDVKTSQNKFDGMIKYNNNRYDLTSGHLIDRRR